MTALTLKPTVKVGDQQGFEVRRGVTFLAFIAFDGPRGTIRILAGALYADEKKEVYRLKPAD